MFYAYWGSVRGIDTAIFMLHDMTHGPRDATTTGS